MRPCEERKEGKGEGGEREETMSSEEESNPIYKSNPADGIATHHYPSQMSAWIADSSTTLSVALERSHAVASLTDGTLDVVQHRRGGPFNGNGGTVVRPGYMVYGIWFIYMFMMCMYLRIYDVTDVFLGIYDVCMMLYRQYY